MAMKLTAELHWFPFYVKDFVASPSVQRMDDAEVGRYVRLLCLAFGNGLREPSLEPDDLKDASNRVQRQFFERDGRFYNETLSRVWHESQTKHRQAIKRGKASGKARRKGKRFETVSKRERNENEQAPVVVGVEYQKDTLARGAGALALEERRPAQQRIAGITKSSPMLVADILAGKAS